MLDFPHLADVENMLPDIAIHRMQDKEKFTLFIDPSDINSW